MLRSWSANGGTCPRSSVDWRRRPGGLSGAPWSNGSMASRAQRGDPERYVDCAACFMLTTKSSSWKLQSVYIASSFTRQLIFHGRVVRWNILMTAVISNLCMKTHQQSNLNLLTTIRNLVLTVSETSLICSGTFVLSQNLLGNEFPYPTTVAYNDNRGWEIIELCERVFPFEDKASKIRDRY